MIRLMIEFVTEIVKNHNHFSQFDFSRNWPLLLWSKFGEKKFERYISNVFERLPGYFCVILNGYCLKIETLWETGMLNSFVANR